jgi:hypothetical protein
MDSITKWKLDLKLSQEEAAEIIQELYNGSKKKLIYESVGFIDKNLIKFYQKFKSDDLSESVLNFSFKKCTLPFVSTKDYGNSSHKIITENCIIYIYE